MLKAHHRHYLAAFLLDCAISAGFTVVPFFIFDHLGGGARMSGIIGAVQAASYATVSIVSSRYVSRAKHGLTWAVAGIACFAVLAALAPFCLNPFLFGAVLSAGFGFMGLVWPAMWSWLGGERDPWLRNRRTACYNVAWSIGLAVGPFFGGALYPLDHRLPFLFVFVVAVAALVLEATLPREKEHFASSAREERERCATRDETSEAHLYYAWFANMVAWVLVGAATRVFPKRIDELVESGRLILFAEGGSTTTLVLEAATLFSFLVVVLNASRAGVFLIMGFTQRWQHRFWLPAVFQIAAGAAFWGLGATRSLVLMALCFAVIGVNGGVSFFASIHYSLTNAALKHGRAAINEGTVGAGIAVGALGFGILARRFGTTMPFLYAPALIPLALGVQALLFRFGLRKNENGV